MAEPVHALEKHHRLSCHRHWSKIVPHQAWVRIPHMHWIAMCVKGRAEQKKLGTELDLTKLWAQTRPLDNSLFLMTWKRELILNATTQLLLS